MNNNLPITKMHEELGVIFAELRTVCERIGSLLSFYSNEAHPSNDTYKEEEEAKL